MRNRRRFWVGIGLVLLVGVPSAFLARAHLQSVGEAEHVHGGDPKLEADLAQLSGAKRLAALRQAAQDAMPTRRLAVAEALAREKNADGLALAKELLTDNDSEVRIKAAYALMQAGAEPEQPFLLAALQDNDLWLRQEVLQWAATNAGRKGGSVGSWLVPGLIARLGETSEAQLTFATSALSKLTGNPWRYTARLSGDEKDATLKKWQAWWHGEKPKYPAAVALPDISPQ